MISNSEMVMPNVEIDARKGISLSAQGDIQMGNIQNQGTSADNQGISITSGGSVSIGIVDSNDDFAVTAGGDISIGEIRNADSISLTVTPPTAGIIKIGGNQTTMSPVICAPTDNCNGFELDGSGSGGDGCNTVNSDPDAPNNCGGGVASPDLVSFLLFVLLWRRRVKNSRGGRTRCSPPPGRSV
jgi:hypothetical protein